MDTRRISVLLALGLLSFALPASAEPASLECADAGSDRGCADAGMAPPEEEDPGGGGCSCFWTDELPEGSWSLAAPWPVLFLLRRTTKKRR